MVGRQGGDIALAEAVGRGGLETFRVVLGRCDAHGIEKLTPREPVDATKGHPPSDGKGALFVFQVHNHSYDPFGYLGEHDEVPVDVFTGDTGARRKRRVYNV